MIQYDEEQASDIDLQRIRATIDKVDEAMTALIQQRLDLASEAAAAKKERGIPHRDLAREVEVVRRASTRASAMGVATEPVRAIFWKLIELSHIANNADSGRGLEE